MFRSKPVPAQGCETELMKLLIAGGGTGGHVFPALAIAREWISRGADRDVVLVGTQRGIEMKLVPQAGLPLETLRVAGLKGKGGITLTENLAMLGSGLADAFAVFKRHTPQLPLAWVVMRPDRCCWPPGSKAFPT